MKDKGILALLDRIDLDSHDWKVVDYWDGDLCAIGIIHKDRPRRLVYVSNFEESPDHYYYECEEPIGPQLTDYASIDSGQNVPFEHLLQVLEQHLALRPSDSRT